MIEDCPKQKELTERIESAMKLSLGAVHCQIVDRGGMTHVMRGAGWAKDQTLGVVGFQLGKDIYVREDAPWTVLHELVHKTGVNADRLSRFVAEGLTEAIALDLRRDKDEHRPTYPEETAWVKQKLLPLLGLSAVELGKRIAKSKDPPRDLARWIAEKAPGTNETELRRQLQPQKTDHPEFPGSRTWDPATHERDLAWRQNRTKLLLSGALLVSGLALGVPVLLAKE